MSVLFLLGSDPGLTPESSGSIDLWAHPSIEGRPSRGSTTSLNRFVLRLGRILEIFDSSNQYESSEDVLGSAEGWRRNRSAAPALFRDEIRRAFVLIRSYPEIGESADDVELQGVRRVLLSETHHYRNYRLTDDESAVEVLAVWSTDRGAPPPI